MDNFPHQGGGRLECQKISPTLQSVLRTLTCSTEPLRLLNSTTRPTRFGVFHLTTSDIVYDVMCKMIQHAYRLPLTFQPLRLKWVELIGPQSEPRQSSYKTNSVWSQIAHL